ncbi:hypothetical protein GCM10011513_40530 [Franconibacter daqui]|nr:hypothetical protein GCM10011513_40530 [Franconibacter daqui]
MRGASQFFSTFNLLIAIRKGAFAGAMRWRVIKQAALPADRYTSDNTCNKAIHV